VSHSRVPRGLPQGAAVALLALGVAACSGPVLANPPLSYPSPPVATPGPTAPSDPIPIALPRDDGPHDRLTEWWYYTGHLHAADGRRYGFEAVIFRAERGTAPTAWAAHLAVTDETFPSFQYAQRSEIGAGVDHSPRDAEGRPTGFDLRITGLNPVLVAAGQPAFATQPWRLAGSGGRDSIEAALEGDEATTAGSSIALDLELESTKPPALHDGDGFVDFGPAGGSYYYSRTRLAATGTLELDGLRFDVTGIAWFDHQWGDFISVGGGWNWFALNLDDGVDVTVSQVLDDRGYPVLTYGTLVDAAGTTQHLDSEDVGISQGALWTSPLSRRPYPVDWDVFLRGRDIRLEPTIPNQELDTRPTTGVIYWEGSQIVSDAETGQRIGQGYVEITRYGD
jgi:predicted secreted hydrolase